MGMGIRRGWEFWLGAAFVAAAVFLIAPAFLIESWREIVSKIGAATAAFAVVGAALISYAGAVSKVRFDRDLQAENRRAAHKNVYLKTHMAAAQLFEEVNYSLRFLRNGSVLQSPNIAAIHNRLRISEPEALFEAWNVLNDLPADCVKNLRKIRLHVKRLERLLNTSADPRSLMNEVHHTEIDEELTSIDSACRELLAILQPTVEQYSVATSPDKSKKQH